GDRPRAGDVVGIRDGDTFYVAAHTDAQGRYSLTLAGSDSATLYHLRRWKGMVNLRYTTRPVSFNAGEVTTVDLPTEESGSIWGTAITDTSLNGRYDAGETATLGYIYIDQDNDW